MKINVEATPNPCAFKFSFGKDISRDNPQTFLTESDCIESSLALNLLSIEEVEIVFFGDNFITITKSKASDFQKIKAKVNIAILDHFHHLGLEVYDRKKDYKSQKSNVTNDINEIEKKIVSVLDEYIKPAIAQDGGDIVYHGFKDGIVKVGLVGACVGCPQSQITLKQGVERTIKYHVSEVKVVETI